MHIKTTMGYYYKYIRMAVISTDMLTSLNADKDMEQVEFSHTQVGMQMVQQL